MDTEQFIEEPIESAAPGADAEIEQKSREFWLEPPSDNVAPFEGEYDSGDEPPVPTPVELLAQREAELEAERSERIRLQQERDAIQAQAAYQQRAVQQNQARQVWDQLEEEAKAQARNLDYDAAIDYMAEFSRQRTAATMQAAQQMTDRVYAKEYREHVINQYQLTPNDVTMLGANPYEFDARARAIVGSRQESQTKLADMEKQIQQLQRAVKSNRRLGSGADRGGMGNGQALPQDLSQLSSRDHIRVLMERGGLLS